MVKHQPVQSTSYGMTYFIGVDGGTESLRAGVFNAQGELLSSCSAVYQTSYPQPGWAEQQPDDWWACFGTAVKGAVKTSGINPEEVAAICVDTTCCTVCALDSTGSPVRPALLWMDMRSAAEATRLVDEARGDPALRVNSGGHGPVSAEWMVPKSMWLKTHEPETWHKAAHVCEYQDFINWRLTGNYVGSLNNASVRWHYDVERGWPVSLLQRVGMEDLLQRWPQQLVAPGQVVGHLTVQAAQHTGLRAGLMVAQGGADAFIGMLGLGVTQPGQMALLTGSSHLQLGMSAGQVTGRGIFGSYNSAVLPGLHVVEGGQTSTGSIINWFKRTLTGPPGAVGYEELNQEAHLVAPGCDGLYCLDHFQGNRTPHTDALSRGALCGLTLAHTRGHVFRCMMEGVAMGTRLILDTMQRAGGYTPSSIAIAGGATRSEVWLQIHADVAGVPFVLTEQPEAPMLGCAILAAAAAGVYPDAVAAAAAMVRVTRTIQPRPEVHQLYEEHFNRYCQLYPALAPLQQGKTGHVTVPTAPSSSSSVPPAPALGKSNAAPVRIIAPSILAADFAHLADEVGAVMAAGAVWVHVDMFDGSTLSRGNFTLGPPVVHSLHVAHPAVFLDCHLAVDDPARYIDAVAAAGAASITFHLEAPGLTQDTTLQRLKQLQLLNEEQQPDVVDAAAALAKHIRSLGVRAGLALSPATPAQAAIHLAQLGAVDMLLVMSVEPGFGGQQFIQDVLPKIRQIRQACPLLDIQVDGGINVETAQAAAAAGANILVAGSAVFGKPATSQPAASKYQPAMNALMQAWSHHD